MIEDFAVQLGDHQLEYIDDIHTYLVDGIIVPSITQILKVRFGHKYDGISTRTLQKAADAGTAMHKAIENYITKGEEDGSEELRNFKFLMKQYKLTPIKSEVPVILYQDGAPFAAGRLDLVLQDGERIGLGDLKRTSTLDKEYLACQLNLYAIAYAQTYGGTPVEFLAGIHLRGTTRKLVPLPINMEWADQIIEEYRRKNDE